MRTRPASKTDAQLLAKVSGVSEKEASYLIASKGLVDAVTHTDCLDSLELSRRVFKTKDSGGEFLNTVVKTKAYMINQLSLLEEEHFSVLFLNNKNKFIAFEVLSTGTIDSANVYPREVVKKVLDYNAASVIFAHNHPSGSTEPSMADKRITEKLKNALDTIDVRCLDHIIVGSGDALSFAEEGLI